MDYRQASILHADVTIGDEQESNLHTNDTNDRQTTVPHLDHTIDHKQAGTAITTYFEFIRKLLLLQAILLVPGSPNNSPLVRYLSVAGSS